MSKQIVKYTKLKLHFATRLVLLYNQAFYKRHEFTQACCKTLSLFSILIILTEICDGVTALNGTFLNIGVTVMVSFPLYI